MLSKIFSIFLSLLTIVLIFSCNATTSNSKQNLDAKIYTFVKALVEKDEAKLVTYYLASSNTFSKNGKLNPDIYNFLYKSGDNSKQKAVNDIVAINDFKTKIIWQKADVFTLLIAKSKDIEKFESLNFLENYWMISYIACEFIVVDGKLEFYQNVCFAETGGPFPTDYEF
jgi:hypothetical protein